MHWRNSNFQLKHFLAGKAHTPDEAYRVLRELAEERLHALEDAEVAAMRCDARMEQLVTCWLKVVCLFSRAARTRRLAEMKELAGTMERTAALVAAAAAELEQIQALIAEVQPLRKFSHLPDPEAHQAAQEEHWLLELKWRAENYLVGLGTIPPEQIEVMRLHPAWSTELSPHITQTMRRVEKHLMAWVPAHGDSPPELPDDAGTERIHPMLREPRPQVVE